MHIAICDDNIADRKHTERLLSRIAHGYKERTGKTLLFHSFGHRNALFLAPKQYDLFLIDMSHSAEDGLMLAIALRTEKGIVAPIVLLVSTVDYRSLPNPPANIFFIDKPICPNELSAIIEQVHTQIAAQEKPIELRSLSKAFYLTEKEIIYAKARKWGSIVYLSNGETIETDNSLYNLFEQLCLHPVFFMLSNKIFVNLDHVAQCSAWKLVLSNKTSLGITPWVAKEVRGFITPQ